MIKSLSPYYFYTEWNSPLTGVQATQYTINLYVWSGNKNDVPAEPLYSLTKKNIGNSSSTDRVNVSRLLNDFISFAPTAQVGLISSTNQLWVHKDIEYTTTDPLDDGVKQLPETELLLKSYSYGNEGENAQPPTDGVFMSGDEFKVDRNTIFSIPLEIGELTTLGDITVVSYPTLEINYVISTGITSESNERVKVLNIDVSDTTKDTSIVVTYNGRTIYLGINEEFKYTPVPIYFLNKEGEQQTLVFFKERTDTLTVTRESYENDSGQPKDGFHQFVDFNIQGRSKFTASSGFVDESLNEVFKQLLLSTKVYEYNGSDMIPLNVSKTDLQYKTRLNDRLINYVIDFQYSYNEINNI